MIERVHPVCEPGCTHQQVPDRGGVIITAAQDKDRAESERFLAGKFPGKRIEFLGLSDAEDWHTQAWRIGAKPWRPMPSAERTEGKQAKREIKYLHRPAFWEGDGPPGPVDFSRPAEPELEPYPAPSLTSDTASPRVASKPASDLIMHAIRNNWAGDITYACGYVPHATHGRPGAIEKFSEALRLSRGDQRAVAVRMGGSWDSLWTWSTSQFFTRHATLAQFREALV
jgi:hypothetical protein